MAESLSVVKPMVVDLLEVPDTPALSSTSDMPVIETKPDASNEGAPPKADPAKVEVTEEVEEQLEESATSTTEEQPGQPAGEKPRGVGKALAELRQQRKDADARALAAEERLNQALKALEQATVKPEPAKETIEDTDPEPVKPVRAAYTDPDTWDQAMVDYADQKAVWAAKREVKAMRTEEQSKANQTQIDEGIKAAQAAYKGRVDKVVEKYADFHEVAESPDIQIPMPVAHAIINHPDGPELQYYLGKNPAEAKRLSSMNPAAQLVELGMILAKITAPVAPAPVSAAPKPITPIKAGTESPNKSADEMTMEEYASMRRQKEGWADPQRPKPNPRARH